jgi:hypothetical protein
MMRTAPAVALLLPLFAFAQTSSKRATMFHATGTFDVKIGQAETSDIGKEGGLGRMTIDKAFHGGIDGTSKGEMLTSMTPENDAMAYVAVEKVTAAVDGKMGTFVLAHRASMLQSDPQAGLMDIQVVPSSGTGELKGISGTFLIEIVGGQHKYDFAYELPVAH